MACFKDINTLEQLRKQYRDLLKKFFPDNANGSTEAAKEINVEYDRLFKELKDRHESKSIGNGNSKDSNANADYNSMNVAVFYSFSHIHTDTIQKMLARFSISNKSKDNIFIYLPIFVKL